MAMLNNQMVYIPGILFLILPLKTLQISLGFPVIVLTFYFIHAWLDGYNHNHPYLSMGISGS